MAEEVKRKRGRPRKNPIPEPKDKIVPLPPKGYQLDPRLKFNEERAQKALDVIKEGAHMRVAAQKAGVSLGTFQEWLSRGENDPDGPFGQFNLEVRDSLADFEMSMLKKVIELGQEKGKWEAFMTILERRFSEGWKRPSEAAQVQVNVGNFGNVLKELHGDVIDAEVVE